MRSQRVLIKMPSTGIRCADPRGGPRALSCAEQRARERDGEEGPCAGEACARPGPSYPRAALNLRPPGGPFNRGKGADAALFLRAVLAPIFKTSV